MSGVVRFQKADRGPRRQATPDPLVAEIVDALNYLGGQSHRDVVITCITATRRSAGAQIPPTLAQDLIASFDEHRRAHLLGPCIFALPFGPGSRRWTLRHESVAMLRDRLRRL